MLMTEAYVQYDMSPNLEVLNCRVSRITSFMRLELWDSRVLTRGTTSVRRYVYASSDLGMDVSDICVRPKACPSCISFIYSVYSLS